MEDVQFRALAEEQAALRRVATLVASGATPEKVFVAVADEVARLPSVAYSSLGRYGSDRTVTLLASAGRNAADVTFDRRRNLGGTNVTTLVFATGRPARVDDYSRATGALGALARLREFGSGAGAPIMVRGDVWGVLSAYSSEDRSLPQDAAPRLVAFAELLALAIANSERRAERIRLGEQQAALGRVATLMAYGASPEEGLAAVTEEVARLLPVDLVTVGRYEPDRTITFLSRWGDGESHSTIGSRWPLGGRNLSTLVFETGRSARIDRYADASGPLGVTARDVSMHSAVASPILVEDRLWGVMAAASTGERPLPADAEARLAPLAELVPLTIAQGTSRTGLAQLVDEQAALHRVATLVARGEHPEEVFAAVIEEVGNLLPVDMAILGRYEPDDALALLATWGRSDGESRPAERLPLGGRNLGTLVLKTGRPVRIDSYTDASGPLSTSAQEAGLRSAVAAPIIVEGRIWGMVGAGSGIEQALPAGTEARLASLTELVAMAIANAESRAELMASRARIVASADEARQRIERDLHDGTQQQLVTLMLDLRTARATHSCDRCELADQLARTEQGLKDVLDALRETARGIHPAILSKAGLGPAFKALARRSAIPVDVTLRAERRLPEPIEVAAYYVVSEALTNAAKHANASVVAVELDAQEEHLLLAIRDDGVGGADPTRGSGLVGITDRIAALSGRLEISSPPGGGTSLSIDIPIERQSITA